MRLYITQCTLGCPHMAGLRWLTPGTVYWEFHFCRGSQKAFRHRQQYGWPPYSWHLQQPLIWQWFTAHALKMHIAPDAAVELYNNNQDINDEICHAEQVNRSKLEGLWGNVSFWCFALHLDWKFTQNKISFEIAQDLRRMSNTMLQMPVYSLRLEVCLFNVFHAGGACKSVGAEVGADATSKQDVNISKYYIFHIFVSKYIQYIHNCKEAHGLQPFTSHCWPVAGEGVSGEDKWF